MVVADREVLQVGETANAAREGAGEAVLPQLNANQLRELTNGGGEATKVTVVSQL